MEQIIALKVDLEYPEEAKFAIDAAAKTYSDFKREQATRRFVEVVRRKMQRKSQSSSSFLTSVFLNTMKEP